MRFPLLHKLDFRWVIAFLPVVIILAGFGAGSLFSGSDSQSGNFGHANQQLLAIDNEVDSDSRDSQAESGMAGESQPAAVPESRWTDSTFYFGKEQSRKGRFRVGLRYGLAGQKRITILSHTCQTSLASVSSKLGRRYTLIGHKPSGTS